MHLSSQTFTKQAVDWGEVWKGIKHHLPRPRLLDTLGGSALGAGLGGGVYGLRRLVSGEDDDEADRMGLLGHLGIGAGLGGVLGNVVGDRARRWVSNRIVPWGYGPSQKKYLKPRSLRDFWEGAILDKPLQLSDKELLKPDSGHENLPRTIWGMRRELLRRGMGLPVRDEENAFFRSIGRHKYAPTKASGGLPGTYRTVELNPKRWAAELARESSIGSEFGPGEWSSFTPQQQAAIKAKYPKHWYHYRPITHMQEALEVSSGRQRGTSANHPDLPARPYLQKNPLESLLARHGTEYTPQTAQVHDLWDFGLTPHEDKLMRQYMKEYASDLTGDTKFMVQGVPGWRGTPDNSFEGPDTLDSFEGWQPTDKKPGFVTNPDGSIAPTRAKHFKVLLHRFMLNELLLKGGGTLFSQKFSRPAPRPFTQRHFAPSITDRPQPVYSPI